MYYLSGYYYIDEVPWLDNDLQKFDFELKLILKQYMVHFTYPDNTYFDTHKVPYSGRFEYVVLK